MTGVASVSPFRLFGRADRTPPAGPDPWLDDPPAAPPPVTAGAAPGWAAGTARPDAGPATAAARPVPWTPRRPPVEPRPDPEPVTDPFGFPPVPPTTTPPTPPAPDDVAAAWAAWAPADPEPASADEPDRGAADAPDPGLEVDVAEASALAGAFAADLLSWDEEDPARRGHALAEHLSAPAAAALLGWAGTGRQRADLVLPGRVRPGTDGRVHVDVRVRVVPYRRVDARGTGAPEPAPEQPLGTPAAAPAVSARGWRGLAARWMRVEVSVVRDGDRLVVDARPAPEVAPAPPSPRDLAVRRRSS